MSASREYSYEALEQRVLERGASFDFLPLVRLLRRLAREQGWHGRHAVRIRPALSMDLPRAPVVGVEKRPDGQYYEVHTTFLGLYGVSSPLPAFYTEELIAAEQEDRAGARVFLDALQQHLYGLHLSGLEKYRPLVGDVEGGQQHFRQVLQSLVGLRDESLATSLPCFPQMLRYVGLFAARQRSAEGLRVLLRDLLDGAPVSVEQCVPRLALIPQRARLQLGCRNHQLGETSVLGEQTEDATGKIRIVVGPLDWPRFSALLHDRARWRSVVSMIRTYLPTPLECDLRLRLDASARERQGLGSEGASRLGVDVWLTRDGEVSTTLEASLQLGR